jgi:hypothetical protein
MNNINDLINQFNNITLMRVFEIEVNDNYALYDIKCNDKCLYTVGYGTKALKVDWDDCFSLDEHLQDLYDKCYSEAIEAEERGLL